MIEQSLTKFLCVIFIVVTMYPTATVPSALPMISVMKHNADKPPVIPKCQKEPNIIHPIYTPETIGFDLTPEEMQKFKIWDKGTIPFYIDIPSFSDKALRDRIRWYLNEVNSLTPLNFMELPRPPVDYQEERWVYFLNRGSYLGCHDISMDNFTTRGVQRVVLGYDCLSRGGGLAEIVLALAGVPPQHNAPNRDEYISVFEDNIAPEKKYLFKKLDNREWLFHDIEYDPESAGHYNEHKHSVNGLATIKWKGYCTDESPLGQDEGFSKNDIKKINMLYYYIVVTKNKADLSTCGKVFERVKNTSRNSIYTNFVAAPRPKPNKYLGIQSDEIKGKYGKLSGEANGGQRLIIKSDNDVNDNVDRDSDENDNNENNNTEYENIEDDNNENYDFGNYHIENQHNKNDNTQIHSEKDTSEKANGRNLVQQKTSRKPLSSYKDPLTFLSDYETGDERLKRSDWRKQNYEKFSKLSSLKPKE